MKRRPFILQFTLGLIRDPRARRSTMFFLLLGALVLLFAGSTFLDGFLVARPLLFLLYWGGCAWFTLTTALLALYDLVAVGAAARAAGRHLRRHVLRAEDEPGKDASHCSGGAPPPSAGGDAPPK